MHNRLRVYAQEDGANHSCKDSYQGESVANYNLHALGGLAEEHVGDNSHIVERGDCRAHHCGHNQPQGVTRGGGDKQLELTHKTGGQRDTSEGQQCQGHSGSQHRVGLTQTGVAGNLVSFSADAVVATAHQADHAEGGNGSQAVNQRVQGDRGQ